MKKEDLKAGYLIEKENGALRILMPIMYNGKETLAMVDDLLTPFCQQILYYDPFVEGEAIRVYGLSNDTRVWMEISTERRPILWEREPKKTKVTLELTDEQIESLRKQGIL